MRTIYILSKHSLPHLTAEELKEIANGEVIYNGALYSLQSENIAPFFIQGEVNEERGVVIRDAWKRIVLIGCEDRYNVLRNDPRIETYCEIKDWRRASQFPNGE